MRLSPAVVLLLGLHVTSAIFLCSPEIKITFADGIRDSSGNEFLVGVRNVRAGRVNGTTDGFAGYFDGQSKLLLYRFDNADFSNQLAIYVRFLENENNDVFGGQNEALLTNGGCAGIDPSVRIGFNRMSSTLYGAVNVGTDLRTDVSYARNEWKDVTYVYNGNKFDVNCSSASSTGSNSVPVTGVIPRKQCALQVGYGQNMAPFVGWIDEIRVYLCIPDHIP